MENSLTQFAGAKQEKSLTFASLLITIMIWFKGVLGSTFVMDLMIAAFPFLSNSVLYFI